MVWDSPAFNVDTLIGASDGGGVRTTRNVNRPGSLLAAATLSVSVPPTSAESDAVTWTTPSCGTSAARPLPPSSNRADQASPAVAPASTVQTWHRAARSTRTDSACGTSMGSLGQRRIGRVDPTWTATDSV